MASKTMLDSSQRSITRQDSDQVVLGNRPLLFLFCMVHVLANIITALFYCTLSGPGHSSIRGSPAGGEVAFQKRKYLCGTGRQNMSLPSNSVLQ